MILNVKWLNFFQDADIVCNTQLILNILENA